MAEPLVKIPQRKEKLVKAKTISHCQGKGSLSHNNRTFKPKNVDSNRSRQNVTFVKMSITEAYDKCFSEAVERYNAKQKRADRRIKDGYFRYAFSHAPSNNVITAADKRKSFYEDVVQIGDRSGDRHSRRRNCRQMSYRIYAGIFRAQPEFLCFQRRSPR